MNGYEDTRLRCVQELEALRNQLKELEQENLHLETVLAERDAEIEVWMQIPVGKCMGSWQMELDKPFQGDDEAPPKISVRRWGLADYLGYPSDTNFLRGHGSVRDIWTIMDADDQKKTTSEFDRFLENPKSVVFYSEYRLRKSVGPWIWSMTWGKKVAQFNDGRPRIIRGKYIDITERKEMERDRDLLRIAAEGAGLGSWEWTIETGGVRRKHERSHLRHTLMDTAVGWDEAVHPSDRERVESATRVFLEQCESDKDRFYDVIHRMPGADNTWLWIHDVGRVIEWDEQGQKPRKCAGVFLDITEREKKERAFHLIADVALGVGNLRDLKEKLQFIAQKCMDTMDATRVLFAVFEEKKGSFTIAAGAGDSVKEVVGKEIMASLPLFQGPLWCDRDVAKSSISDQEGKLVGSHRIRSTESDAIQCLLQDVCGTGSKVDGISVPCLGPEGQIMGVFCAIPKKETVNGVRTEWNRIDESTLSILGQYAAAEIVRHRTEEELRNRTELLDRAVAAGKLELWSWNPEADKVTRYPHSGSLLGYEEGELPNTLDAMEHLTYEKDLPRLKRHRAALREGNSSHTPYRIRDKQGRYRWILDFGGAIASEGPMKGLLSGAHVDITAEKEHEERFRAAYEISKAMTGDKSLRDCLQWIVDISAVTLAAEKCHIGLIDEHRMCLRMYVLSNNGVYNNRDKFIQLTIPNGLGMEAEVALSGSAKQCEDYLKEYTAQHTFKNFIGKRLDGLWEKCLKVYAACEAEGLRAGIAVPLEIDRRDSPGKKTTKGVLWAFNPTEPGKQKWEEADVFTLQAFANLAAIEVDRRDSARFRVLYDVALSLSTSLDPEKNLELILHSARTLLKADCGDIALSEDGRRRLSPDYSSGYHKVRRKDRREIAEEGVSGQVIREGKGIVVDNYYAYAKSRGWQRLANLYGCHEDGTGEGIMAGIAAPILSPAVGADSEESMKPVEGAILVWSRDSSRRFDFSELDTLQLLANFCSVELHRLRVDEDRRRKDALFRGVFEQAGNGIFVLDRRRRYVHVNRKFAEILAMCQEEILGKTDKDLHGVEIGNMMRVKNENVLAGEAQTFNWVLVNDEQHVDIQETRVPLVTRSSQSVDRILGMVLDVSAILTRADLDEFCAKSKLMTDALRQAKKAAQRDMVILITGETGTGKTKLAEYIHGHSNRRDKLFVKTDIGQLTESLIESELFGHKSGSFTGALHTQKGLVEHAEGGTLFLDEIGNASPEVQKKLLRLVQEKKYLTVGDPRERTADVRIIVATKEDLQAKLVSGEFRDDLYYRLEGFQIYIPPLRERPEDLEPLVTGILDRIREQYSRNIRLGPGAWARIRQYGWPGNVRQLENVLEGAVVRLDDDKDIIRMKHIDAALDPQRLTTGRSESRSSKSPSWFIDYGEKKVCIELYLPLKEGSRYDQVIGQIKKEIVEEALTFSKGERAKVWELLQITPGNLRKKIHDHKQSAGRTEYGYQVGNRRKRKAGPKS